MFQSTLARRWHHFSLRRVLPLAAAFALASLTFTAVPVQAQPADDPPPPTEPQPDDDPVDATIDYLLWLLGILLG